MSNNKLNPLSNLSTFRVEALEDGIFAIAMTLLVLDLKIPDSVNGTLLNAVLQIWPHLVTYFGSFILLGVFWFGHRAALHYIKKADQVYHWLNLLMLMFVSIVPFTASLISRYYNEESAVIFYGLNLVCIGLSMYIQWVYASRNYRLIDPDLPVFVIRYAKTRSIFAPICYTSAIILSFVDIRISLVIYTIVPVLYIVPIFQPFWRYLTNLGVNTSKSI